MASRTCWRCLTTCSPTLTSSVTTTLALRPAVTQLSAFSTSAFLQKNPHSPAARKGVQVKPSRGGRTLRLSKNKRAKTARPPATGERKAIRKRIVLSNTNAFEVSGLQDWSADNIASDALLGRMVGLPGSAVDGLRAAESFKSSQGWGFFRRPASLVRKETLELARHIENHGGQSLRRLVIGEKGVGKSALVLQAHAMAFLKGWVVVHIPEGTSTPAKSLRLAPHRSSILTDCSQPTTLSSRKQHTHPSRRPHLPCTSKKTIPPPSSPQSQRQTSPSSPSSP